MSNVFSFLKLKIKEVNLMARKEERREERKEDRRVRERREK